jgi:hypothetical protein
MKPILALLLLSGCYEAPCWSGVCTFDMDLEDVEAVVDSTPVEDLALTLWKQWPVEVHTNQALEPGVLGFTNWNVNVWGDRVGGFTILIRDRLDRCQECIVLAHELLHVYLISMLNETGHKVGWFRDFTPEGGSVEFHAVVEMYRSGVCGCQP